MIIDCHAQIWEAGSRMATLVAPDSQPISATLGRYLDAVHPVDRSILLGFKSNYLKAEISNEGLADAVKRHPAKLIGFAGIDPTDENCLDELCTAQDRWRLKGVTVSPSLQDFHPCDTRAMAVYAECARRGMPVVFEQSHRCPAAKMEFARPALLDEVAREFPNLRVVVSHMGYPWVDECVALLGKHLNVYANVAGLLPQAWRSYSALLSAYEYGVMGKLLFGSDFPYRSPAACIEALYSVNLLCSGTNLTTIPREQLRGIVERDALTLLGIGVEGAEREITRSVIVDDE